jgi:hypothetical protein
VRRESNFATLLRFCKLQVELHAASMILSGARLTVVVVNGSVSSGSNASSNVPVTNLVPTIASLVPVTALTGDGPLNVTITGTGFMPTTSVSLIGAPRTTAYATNTQITATLTGNDLSSPGTLESRLKCSSCRIADLCLLGLLDGHGTVETVESAFEISESFGRRYAIHDAELLIA